MIVVDNENKLKLGKGVAFVKSQLKRLSQEDEIWEADFRALPKPIMQSATHYVGLVLTHPDGFLRAELRIEQSPIVNDLATLLAHAMKRPLVEGHYRPRTIHVRGNPKWKPLFPALQEIRVEVLIKTELPQVEDAYREFLTVMREVRSAGKVKPTAKQVQVEATFPAITRWVNDDGHIEIGAGGPERFFRGGAAVGGGSVCTHV